MSEPFNFNTPITENTTLVARYRCGEAPYAGKWFRVTMNDGNRYVPVDFANAKKLFGTATGIGDFSKATLMNVDTGVPTTGLLSLNITKIEFGGGWNNFRPENPIPIYDTYFTNTYYVTGYPEGLGLPTNSDYGWFNINFSKQTNKKIDYTGFKFTGDMYNALVASPASLFNPGGIGNGQMGTNSGACGIVEPLTPPPSSTRYKAYAFAGYGTGGSSILNYSVGTGFVGPYAQQWADTFPTGQDYTSHAFRKTYVA